MEMNYDDKGLRALESEIHVEILPGTEIMADVAGQSFVKSTDRSHRVLVPQPTNDPHDPLNWSFMWKISAIAQATGVTFVQGFGPLSIAPLFPYLIKDFNSTLTDVVQFSSVCILVLGFSNFIWVPISTAFGRRPVYVMSQLIVLGSCIWRARAKSYGSFMGASVLHGIGAGPAESIEPAIIADIFFLHDRGKWNTFYWVTYFGALTLGPIIAGSMALHVGWRNFWWFNVGLTGVSLVLVIFLFPETKWHRIHPQEIREQSGTHSAMQEDGTVEVNSDKIMTSLKNTKQAEHGEEPRDQWLGRGRPSKQQWLFIQPNSNPWQALSESFSTPWKLFMFPIVEWAAFLSSWSCSSWLTLNLTQSQVFAAPPYNFSSQTVGFLNFSTLVGTTIGLFTAGPLSDWISARATKRNCGIREPEMRLPALIPYVLIMLLGNVVVSIGYQRSWPWEAIVIIGYACAGIQVAAIPPIVSTYAVDSYKPVAGSLFVAITVNKNIWGYGLGRFITPWTIQSGFIAPIMTNAALITFWSLFGFIFYFYGKTFRRWSKNSSVHLA